MEYKRQRGSRSVSEKLLNRSKKKSPSRYAVYCAEHNHGIASSDAAEIERWNEEHEKKYGYRSAFVRRMGDVLGRW